MTNLPATMTAIEITTYGGPEVLTPVSRPLPQPAPDEVLIKVAAAGVNRPDCLQRQGNYAPPPDASDLPGLEVSGTVVALGAEASQWNLGDELCALTSGGGYAEYCVAPANQCLPIPQGLDLVQAAALPETYFTVWTNVFERGKLRAGETILIHGGSSGIGTTAIQLANAMGARAFTTVGNADKAKVCAELGAELTINYREEDFVAAVRQATDDRGVDVILDMVGGDYVQRNLKALALEGRLLQIAFLKSEKMELNLLPLMVKRLTFTGSTLRPQSKERKAVIARGLRENVWPLLETGKVQPVIHRIFPLAEAAGAHALMESSQHIGKIMLKTDAAA